MRIDAVRFKCPHFVRLDHGHNTILRLRTKLCQRYFVSIPNAGMTAFPWSRYTRISDTPFYVAPLSSENELLPVSKASLDCTVTTNHHLSLHHLPDYHLHQTRAAFDILDWKFSTSRIMRRGPLIMEMLMWLEWLVHINAARRRSTSVDWVDQICAS